GYDLIPNSHRVSSMRKQLFTGLLVAVIAIPSVIASTVASAQEKVIRVSVVPADPNAPYSLDMLRLALTHIDKDYRIEEVTDDFTQTRVNEEVRIGGRLDLAWIASDKELEETLRPIRIPLFKGLLGYRIFIINKDNQFKFDGIETLDELKRKITMGQGS